MILRALVLLGLILIACKPDDGDETMQTTSTTTTSVTGTTGAETGTPTSTGGEVDSSGGESSSTGDSDLEICEAFCANYMAAGCGGCDPPACVQNIAAYAQFGCDDEQRAMVACEAANPLDAGCEASACAAAYVQEDICDGGGCTHLGATYGSIFGDDECTWQGFACYGHELAMSCTPTADAQCSCQIDGEEIATCALGADLVPQTCGDFEVLAGCCTDAFLAALDL